MKTLYVGNLPYTSSEDDIRSLFSSHGSVNSVKLIKDRDSGRPRGFGFVEMDDTGADSAIEKLNGDDFGGRRLKVNHARSRSQPAA